MVVVVVVVVVFISHLRVHLSRQHLLGLTALFWWLINDGTDMGSRGPWRSWSPGVSGRQEIVEQWGLVAPGVHGPNPCQLEPRLVAVNWSRA